MDDRVLGHLASRLANPTKARSGPDFHDIPSQRARRLKKMGRMAAMARNGDGPSLGDEMGARGLVRRGVRVGLGTCSPRARVMGYCTVVENGMPR